MKLPTLLPAEFYLLLCGIFILLISGIIGVSGVQAIKALLTRCSRQETGSHPKPGSCARPVASRLAVLADLVFAALALLLLVELAATCLR